MKRPMYKTAIKVNNIFKLSKKSKRKTKIRVVGIIDLIDQ